MRPRQSRIPALNQTRAIKQLKARWRLALTGTPVENKLGDLWSVFDFLSPGLLGSAKAFNGFCKSLASRKHNAYAPLRKLVQPYILRRLKTDKSVISDLPDKTEVTAHCLLSKQQATLYQKSVEELARIIKEVEGIERRGVVLAFLMRFKQICNHPSQWLGDNEYAAGHSGKFARLRDSFGTDFRAPGQAAGLHAVPRDDSASGTLSCREFRQAGPDSSRGHCRQKEARPGRTVSAR